MDDLISRQAALEKVRAMQTYKLFMDDDMILVDKADVQAELMMMPPAQPERQRGEWIEISSINHTYKCSECGRLLVNVADGRNNVSKHYPYCHCGADMRGEKMDDLISRQASCEYALNQKDKSVTPNDIMRFPSVQPEPREGHWILHESPDGGEQYECSRCGVLWEFNDGTPEDNEAYFCPKCGAKMKGAEHETN